MNLERLIPMASKDIYTITARKRSLGQGNIFTPVCHSVHGGVLSQHALQVVSQHALLGVLSQHALQGGLLPGGGGGGAWWRRILLEFILGHLGLKFYRREDH